MYSCCKTPSDGNRFWEVKAMEGIVETVTMFEGSILSATFDTSSLGPQMCVFFCSRFFCRVFVGDQERQPTEKAVSEGLKNALWIWWKMRELNSVVDYFSAGCKKIPKHEISLLFLIVYRLLGPGNQKETRPAVVFGAPQLKGLVRPLRPATISKKKRFPIGSIFFWWWF